MSLPQCDAFGYIYEPDGTPTVGLLVTLQKVIDADGNPIALDPRTTTTDSTGRYSFNLPQNSTAYLTARASTFSACNGGTPFRVPAATSGELVPAFVPGGSLVAPPLVYAGGILSIPQASATQDGYLSAADWALFNAGSAATAGVVTFNGRSGAVVPVQTDYAVFTPTTQGMVPAPGTPSTTKYLRDDGTWQMPPGGTSGGGGLLPGEYLVTDYGASGSKNTYAGSIGSGGTVLTMATATDFQVGQGIYIKGAGPAGAALLTKVTSVSGVTIVVQNAASTTISAVAGNVQHDDTVAIQAALDAMGAAAGGTLYFTPGTYRVNGPIGSFNSILKLPFNNWTSATGDKSGPPPPSFALKGSPFPVATVLTKPPMSGVIIQSDVLADASKFILAGGLYNDGTDIASGNCSSVYIDGFIFRTYDNPQIGGVDLGMMWNCVVKNVLVDTGMSGEGNGVFGGTLPGGAQPTHGAIGLRLPRVNVCTLVLTENLSVTNYGVGVVGSELWKSSQTWVQRCGVGIQSHNVPTNYPVTGNLLIVQCTIGMQALTRWVLDLHVEFENEPSGTWFATTPGRYLYDPNDVTVGQVKWINIGGGSGGGASQPISWTGCSKLALVSLDRYDKQIVDAVLQGNSRVQNEINILGDLVLAGKIVSTDANDTAGSGYQRLRVPNDSAGGGNLTTGLLAYWKLDETSGLRHDSLMSTDMATNRLDLNQPGIQNTAYKTITDGGTNDNWLQAADAPLWNLTGSFTICGWIKPVELTTNMHTLLSKWGAAGSRQFYVAHNGFISKVECGVSADGTNPVKVSSAANLSGNWDFIAFWYNNSDHTINLQINNGTVVSASFTGPVQHTSANLAIGLFYDGSAWFGNSGIDEVGVWTRVLTATEIQALYNSGSGLTYPFSAIPPDSTAPIISNISSGTPGSTTATITWDTNEPADSQVDWGLTS